MLFMKMNSKSFFIKTFALVGLMLVNLVQSKAQSLQHPLIYATKEDRSKILENLEKEDWARRLFTQMKAAVDPKLEIHAKKPDEIFKNLPALPEKDDLSEADANPLATAHHQALIMASYSSMLYFLTEEEKYAAFAGDILNYYVELLHDKKEEYATICGNHFYDPRTTFPHFAVSYDFIYNYLHKNKPLLYSYTSKKREVFNASKTQKALLAIISNALLESGGKDTHGRFISNHHILTTPGTLFPILCVEDDQERERLFKVFWEEGTRRQASFKNTVLTSFGEQGVWPESTSYSFMPNVPMALNILDRLKPELQIISKNANLLEGIFLFENLRNPNRSFVRYGDSKRSIDATDKLYRIALNIAKRNGLKEIQEKAEVSLKQYYASSGAYKPNLPSGIFDNYTATELFWGEVLPTVSVQPFNYTPTVLIKHAGIALQRNQTEKQNDLYGLCGIIGGAHYVHSHVTGISMELYGAGYVMAPNGGLPNSLAERRIPTHRNYFMRHAGNNTVIINGSSRGRQEGSWAKGIYIWQNTVINLAAEPKHLEEPLSPNFSFATQFLKDEVNNAEQERTLGILRTSETSAYYLDFFRSKSLGQNNFHDYIYHNLGDEVILKNASTGAALSTSPTDKFNNDVGDPIQSPGWRLFENPASSESLSDPINATFKINADQRFMHVFMPGGVEREYAKAFGPPTREAENGYVNKKTPIIAIRQKGEAWETPFIGVFEPSLHAKGSVVSVEQFRSEGRTQGALVTSKVGEKTVRDYVLLGEKENSLITIPELEIRFKGRYGVVRVEVVQGNAEITLYVGDGELISFGNFELNTGAARKGIALFKEILLSMDVQENGAGIEIFPNPADSVFTIRSANEWNKIQVLDIQGKVLLENRLPNSSIDVHANTIGLKSGTYLIKISDKENKSSTSKIVIR